MSASQTSGWRGPSTGKAIRGGRNASSSRTTSKSSTVNEKLPAAIGLVPHSRQSHQSSRSRSSTRSSPPVIEEGPDDVPIVDRLPKIGRLVIGVDLGTTQKAIATLEVPYDKNESTKPDPARYTPKVYDMWLSRDEGGQKYPSTSLYYEDDRELPYTGNSLQLVFEDPKFDRSRLIRLLKIKFHHHKNDPAIVLIQRRVQQQLDREGKSADEALHDIAKIILNELLAKRGKLSYLEQQYDHFAQLDIEMVITVPPGRSTVDHERVRRAFMQDPFNATNVYLESEPAAMFRSWVHEGESTRDWEVGKRYLIGDAGGGTCCFVRYRLEQLSPSLGFKQEYASESIAWGAETISEAFDRLASSKVPDDWDGKGDEVASMRSKFDTVFKMSFGIEPERKKSMSFARLDRRKGYWEFSFDEIASCFNPCIEKLVEGLTAQMADRPPVDCLVLGGGLASNPYVLNCLRRKFSDLQIRELGRDKKHVVVGAVLSRINDDFVIDHPIPRSKAVFTWYAVDNKMRKSKLYRRLQIEKGRDGKEYFWGAMYLVKKGDQAAKLRKVISSELSVKDARHVEFETTNRKPEFSEEIATFNYVPGNDEWAAQCKDESWTDMRGRLIPSPEYSETVSWSPWAQTTTDYGVEIDDFEDGKSEGRGSTPSFKIMRYSIEMKVTETTTRTWVKVWSSPEMKRKTGKSVAFVSHPESQKPIFHSQSISKSLAQSFDFEAKSQQTATSTSLDNEIAGSSRTSPSPSNFSTAEQPPARLPSTGTLSAQNPPNFRAPVPARKTSIPAQAASARPVVIYKLVPEPEKTKVGSVSATPFNGTSSTMPQDRLQIARPTQGQNTEGGVEYAVGAPRNNKGKGCWTCTLRNTKCPQEKPQCQECSRFKLTCDYGRPVWWYDEALKAEQQAKNKALVRENRTRTVKPLQRKGELDMGEGVQASSVKPSIATKTNYQTPSLNSTSKQGDWPAINTLQKRPASAISGVNTNEKTHANVEEREVFHVSTPPRKLQRMDDDSISVDSRLSTSAPGSASEMRRSGRTRTPRVLPEHMRDWASLTEKDDYGLGDDE